MACNDWPYVPLGELLTQVQDNVTIADDTLYKQVTVRLHNKGLVLRQEVPGREIKTKRQYRVRTGQLVYSRIDARNGAIGFVPSTLDNAVVSNDFPVFDVQAEKIDPQFLRYYSSTETFLAECQAASAGTTNRRRLKEAQFLRIPVPLPSLDEQRRVVARVVTVADRAREALNLQTAAIEEVDALYASVKSSAFCRGAVACSVVQPLEEVVSVKMGQSPPGSSYNKSGDGIPLLNGPTEFGQQHPTETQWTTAPTKLCGPGDILICVRGATTGRMNWADKQYCIGRGLAALRVNTATCMPEYVYHFVATQTQQMLELSTGTTFPNLSGEKLRQLEIPVPSLTEQQRIVAYLDRLLARLTVLKEEQEGTAKELEALMPSVFDKAFRGEL